VDDDLETNAVITTANGFQDSTFAGDQFYRAFIDKKTGAVAFQVYERITYGDAAWRFYETVNYRTDDGLQSQSVTVINRSVNCEGVSVTRVCIYTEDVAFEVPEELLRKHAAMYTPNGANSWLLRYKSKAGTSVDDGFLPAETAGLLMAVDAYKANHRPGAVSIGMIAPGARDLAAAMPFGADLGNSAAMWGLPAGALVAGVSKASVASKAGLHWADSIIEWNGKPVRSAAELQAELKGARAGMKVPFKALRGRKVHELVAEF